MATIATKLGADPVPHNSREVHRIIQTSIPFVRAGTFGLAQTVR